MSILNYFKEKSFSCLPNPRRCSITGVPAMAVVSANDEVEKELSRKKTKKRGGKYNKYTDIQRAEIGRYANENGVKSAIKKFSREYASASKINESTIRGFVKAYQAEVRQRRQQGDSSRVKTLPLKKQGRPLLLGRIDRSLQ